ncbi:hypothetical protein F1728_22965 [Gimesia benthica]|uniref:Uncharacterized protein n=1 Tax=Gimesia benthica TaxID=2608982 RepID=A0A6I6ALE7_9PLAN|nr:hypothetical protein [Gimesia benthica]QGQ25369.1 hypothetical protein F1728_22965 [Gimesia benthica]
MNKDINSTELKQVVVREIDVVAMLVDQSDWGAVVLRVRVYENKFSCDPVRPFEIVDVQMDYDQHEDFHQFRRCMTTQHAIKPRVIGVDEFIDDLALLNKVWASYLAENIGQYKEALRMENPEAYESELNQGFDGGAE